MEQKIDENRKKFDIKIGHISFINIIIGIYIFSAIYADEGAILMKIARVLLVGTYFITLCFYKEIRFNTYVIWLFAFVSFSAVSTIWAIDKAIALSMVWTLCINGICMYSLLQLIDYQTERIKVVLKYMVFCPIILELKVIKESGIFAFLSSRIVSGISGNTVGMCAAFGACIAIYFIVKERSNTRYVFILASIINIGILLLSGSRKALLCLIVPMMCVYIFSNKKNIFKIIRRMFFVFIFITIGYVLLLEIPALYSLIGHRLQTMVVGVFGIGTISDSSTIIRMRLISWGIEWFKEKKLLGYGVDNFRIVLHFFHPDYPLSYYAHNNYVELLVDLGIVGVLIYYFIYLYIIVISIKNRKNVQHFHILFLGILIAIIVNEYGVVSYYDKYIQILILTIWIVISELKKVKN